MAISTRVRPFRERRPTIDRFMAKVDFRRPNGCWGWRGAKSSYGYGQIFDRGVLFHAPRWSYETFVAPIPAGLIVMHRCDNPECANPDHLTLGTKADNSADMVRKGRQSVGCALPQAKLTPEVVREIRAASGTQAQIAKRFGVSQSTISNVRARIRWSHVA